MPSKEKNPEFQLPGTIVNGFYRVEARSREDLNSPIIEAKCIGHSNVPLPTLIRDVFLQFVGIFKQGFSSRNPDNKSFYFWNICLHSGENLKDNHGNDLFLRVQKEDMYFLFRGIIKKRVVNFDPLFLIAIEKGSANPGDFEQNFPQHRLALAINKSNRINLSQIKEKYVVACSNCDFVPTWWASVPRDYPCDKCHQPFRGYWRLGRLVECQLKYIEIDPVHILMGKTIELQVSHENIMRGMEFPLDQTATFIELYQNLCPNHVIGPFRIEITQDLELVSGHRGLSGQIFLSTEEIPSLPGTFLVPRSSYPTDGFAVQPINISTPSLSENTVGTPRAPSNSPTTNIEAPAPTHGLPHNIDENSKLSEALAKDGLKREKQHLKKVVSLNNRGPPLKTFDGTDKILNGKESISQVYLKPMGMDRWDGGVNFKFQFCNSEGKSISCCVQFPPKNEMFNTGIVKLSNPALNKILYHIQSTRGQVENRFLQLFAAENPKDAKHPFKILDREVIRAKKRTHPKPAQDVQCCTNCKAYLIHYSYNNFHEFWDRSLDYCPYCDKRLEIQVRANEFTALTIGNTTLAALEQRKLLYSLWIKYRDREIPLWISVKHMLQIIEDYAALYPNQLIGPVDVLLGISKDMLHIKDIVFMGEDAIRNVIEEISKKIETNTPLSRDELHFPYLLEYRSHIEALCVKFPNDVAKKIQEILQSRSSIALTDSPFKLML